MWLARVVGKNVFLERVDYSSEITRLCRRRPEKPRVQLGTRNSRNYGLVTDVRVMLSHQVRDLVAECLHCFKIEIEWRSGQWIYLTRKGTENSRSSHEYFITPPVPCGTMTKVNASTGFVRVD